MMNQKCLMNCTKAPSKITERTISYMVQQKKL